MFQQISRIFSNFNQLLRENAMRSTYSMVAVGAIGTVAHCLYGVLWTQVAPLEHESVWLRVIGALSCFGLLIHKRWPASLKRFLPWYWFAAVMYSLPFFATFQLLGSNYSTLRSMLEVTMAFFVIIVFSQPALAITNMAIGVALAVLFASQTIPNFGGLNHSMLVPVHLHVMLFTLIGGLVFSRSNLRGLLAQEKVEVMKALVGSIAHEMKSPMDQLSQRLNKVGTLLPNHVVGVQTQTIHVSDLEAVYTEIAKCKEGVQRSSQVVLMTMEEIHAKPIDLSGHRFLSATATVNKALEEFSYTKASDRERISVLTNMDFTFKGDETRFIFTLSNLLKNAIYYFDQYPKARIVITVGYETVTVEDTGPGMKPEVLARVFEAFHSVGKPGGTGLGLSFCKRTMQAFGGSIRCESVPGAFTRFVMRFPYVAPREVIAYDESVRKRAMDLFKGRRILVVDDSRHFRNMTKKMLVVLDAVVEEAEDGNEALAKLADHAYDIMLLDLSMPGLDGYATAEKLRDGAIPGLENLAIVAHSSESPHAAKARLERLGVNEFASKGCNPLELFNAMCRAHDASAAQTKNQKDLETRVKPASKTILVADDEDFCRKFVRTVLLSKGFQVMDAPSGQIALGLLNDASVKIDAVITDIHMPGLDGYEIARTLRARPLPQGTMPVIALSAHCDDAMLSHAREAGINGFLTKPVSEIELLQALSQQLGGESGVHDAPAEEVAEPATAASSRASLLLDAIKLERLHRMGYVKEDFLHGLNEARAKMEELAACVETNDMARIKALLHSLMGLSGTLGAQAVHEAMQARYVTLLESGHCLIDKNDLTRLSQLLASTDREMQVHLKGKYAAL